MRSFVLVTLDSCRLDSFQRARTPFFDSLGECIPGRVHADSTLPSHKALFAGFLPICSEWHYKQPFMGLHMSRSFKRVGYTCLGASSLPWCSSTFGFDAGFDAWDEEWQGWKEGEVYVKPLEQSLAFFSDEMEKRVGPFFLFLNVGETHMPYRHAGQEPNPWERIHGNLVQDFAYHRMDVPPALLREMHEAQIEMVEWVDARLGELADREHEAKGWTGNLREDAVWLITSDHGELFGEDHLFGHGHGGHPLEMTVPVLCSDWDWMRSMIEKGERA